MAKPYVDNWLQTRQSVNDIVSCLLGHGPQDQYVVHYANGAAEKLNTLAPNCSTTCAIRAGCLWSKRVRRFHERVGAVVQPGSSPSAAQEHMAAVLRHPVSQNSSASTPSGLNASSEGELRSFYDWIEHIRKPVPQAADNRSELRPAFAVWRCRPEIDIKFEPLWALDEKERAEVNKIDARRANPN